MVTLWNRNGSKRHHVVLLSVLVSLLSVIAIPGAAAFADTAAGSKNAWSNDYRHNWTKTVKSYLTELPDGSFERVEWIDDHLIVERYSSSFELISNRVVDADTYTPSDLAEGKKVSWGGYFSGATYNFVITGQSNGDKVGGRTVYRVSKYSKEWAFLASCEASNPTGTNSGYVALPFDAGSLRAVEKGDKLYIRTSRERYDGHQQSTSFVVKQSDMSLLLDTWSSSSVSSRFGHVSHSFNQFQAILNGDVYAADHGDAYPRSMVITKTRETAGTAIQTDAFPLSGNSGDNHTYASIGGFESSSTRQTLLLVGNAADQAKVAACSTSTEKEALARNAWLTVTSADLSSTSVIPLTTLADSSESWTTTPDLVKINEDKFLIMWGTCKGKHYGGWSTLPSGFNSEINYLYVDGNGQALSAVKTIQGNLSDCQPILAGGKVVWYVTGEDGADGYTEPVFYSIDLTTDAYEVSNPWVFAKVTFTGSFAYKGTPHTPEPEIVFEGQTLIKDVDYTLTYTDNVNAGVASVYIEGIGSYSGYAIKKSFTIATRSISSVRCVFEPAEYTGSVLLPKPTVTYGGMTLVEGVDYLLSYASQSVALGSYSVTVWGLGNFSPNMGIGKTYTIVPASLTNATITGVATETPFTGQAITPEPTIVVGQNTLVKGTDYTLSYSNNINAGTATITITGIGNYKNTATKTFTITKASIASATLTGVNATYLYSGQAQSPIPTVKLGGVTLVKESDYTVAYAANTNAGTATITVTGKGNYQGTATKIFTIAPADIAGAEIIGLEAGYVYTGSAITPAFSVQHNGITLVKDVDYTVSITNNTQVGSTATLTLTGSGNYTGTLVGTFAVMAYSINTAVISGVELSYGYTGNAITIPLLVVTLEGSTLVRDTDYTVAYTSNTAVGEALITITGIGNYSGSLSGGFSITPATVQGATISLTPSTYTYTGDPLVPEPTVVVGGRTLSKDTDYTLSYEDNTAAGTAKVIVSGVGNYEGTAELPFTIAAAYITGATVTGIDTVNPYPYTGTPQAPRPVVEFAGGKILEEGTDYTLSYEGNTAVGPAKLVVTGVGNYQGQLPDIYFTIGKANISSATIAGLATSYPYTGSAVRPEPTLEFNGIPLTKDTDYTLSYSKNTAIGNNTAVITINGKGNFEGSVQKRFSITKVVTALDASTKVSGVEAGYTYTGSAITPQVSVVHGGKTLTKGTDYTVTYAKNTAVGTATITIKGIGSYSGTVTKTFKIVAAAKPEPKPQPTKTSFTRLAGAHRYATMSSILQTAFTGNSCSTVVVATGENYPDALAASGLAGLHNAPIILTASSTLVDEARSEIKRLGATHAILIGSPSALSTSVEDSLKKMKLSTTRVAGSNRIETANKIYEAGISVGTGWGKTAIVASGSGFADALSISSYSYASRAPIFLTGGDKALTQETTAQIRNGGFTKVIIVGSNAAVSSQVESQLSGISIERLGGTDRYQTSLKIAEFGLRNGLSADGLAVATGANFPDALAGAALCGQKTSVILLVADNDVAKGHAASFLSTNKNSIAGGYVLGSESVVSAGLHRYLEGKAS